MKLLSRVGLGALAAFAIGAAVAPSAQAQTPGPTAYAIANGGTTLIRFDINNPTVAFSVGEFNGADTFLDAIDFRPLNGQLYGYRDITDTLYTVDLNTATLTAVASGVAGATRATDSRTDTNLLDLDFNPTIDRVRVVDAGTKNLVYNPNSSAAPTIATDLAYASPSTQVAQIVGNAYTNNLAGATTTLQYGINAANNSLVRIDNNPGTLTDIGSLGITIDRTYTYAGFDIFTTLGGVDTAYGLFDSTPGLAPTLYTINLANGAATSIGTISNFGQVYSLAVTPTLSAAAAPEPGTLALALMGAGALTGRIVVRRRKSA